MGLRIATSDDINLIVSMGMKFIATTKNKDNADEAEVRKLTEELMAKPRSESICILYDDVGMIAGVANKFIFGKKKFAYEMGWWVEPEERKKGVGQELLNSFEFWAKATGCSQIVMVAIDPITCKFYEGNGYLPNEYGYIKEI